MSEYERITEMRRTWISQSQRDLDTDGSAMRHMMDPHTMMVGQYAMTATEDETGIRFQRCGGGRRVIRKKIGGD